MNKAKQSSTTNTEQQAKSSNPQRQALLYLEGLTINAGHPSIEVAASWKRTCRKGIWKEIDQITFRDTPSNKRINTLEPIKTTFVCFHLRNLTSIRMTLGIINNQKEKEGHRKRLIFNHIIAWKSSKGQNPLKGVSSVHHLLSLMFCPLSISNIINCFVFRKSSLPWWQWGILGSSILLHHQFGFGQHARNQQRSGGVWTSSYFFSLMLSIIDLQPLLGWNRLWGVHHATESCTIDQAGVKLKEAGYVH